MSHRARRVLALSLAAALAAAPALAQQRAQAEPEDDTKKKSKPRLTLDLGAEESYESNVPYTTVLNQDDFITRGSARLTAILPIRRGQVELGAEGGTNVYRTVKALDRYTWGFLGGVEQRISRRSEYTLRARSSRDYARDNQSLTVSGTLPPLTLVRNDHAEGSFRQRLGRGFDLLFEGRGEYFRFDAPLLRNGWTAGGRAGVENAFSPSFSLGADAIYGRTATTAEDPLAPETPNVPGAAGTPRVGTTIEVGSAVATLRWQLARGVVLRAEGGAARFGPVGEPATAAAASPAVPELAPTVPRTTPTMAANLSCTIGPHTLTAIASRRIEQTYGIGAIGVNGVLALEYRVVMARWATFMVHGSNNHNSAPDGVLMSKGRSVSAGFDCALPADFTTRLTYSYWDRQDPDRDWRSHTVTLGLSKRFSWR